MDNENDAAYQNILNALNIHSSAIENIGINKAVDLAIQYNNINSNKTLTSHSFSTAKILINMRLDNNSVIVALLYDLFESSTLTLPEIRENFDKEVVWLIQSLNKALKVQLPQNQLMTFPEKCRRLFMAVVSDIRVLLIVLAKRLHMMRCINSIKCREARTRITIETLSVYAPIAERIGLLAIKYELYDLCFKVLHLNARKFIINKLNLIHGNEIHYLDVIEDDIKSLCTNKNIKTRVFGRLKTPYSIWLKMNRKKKAIEQLMDIIGLRIIVNDIDDCYKVLYLIKNHYKYVENSYRDFIKKPKDNNYQSIHIVIIGKRQEEIEIQIRTQEMHEIAESGNAAHWRYKQGYNNEDWEQYKFIKRILADFYESNNLELFLQNTKISTYYNNIFCVTQDERVLVLEQTSTPLDLAYKLHYTIGSKYIKAKVNGNLVPLEHQLKTGDNVEIITEKTYNDSLSTQALSRNSIWSTSNTISANNKRILYIKSGEALINEFCKAINIHNPYSVLMDICNFLQYKDINALYFAIGKRAINIRKVVNYIIAKYNLAKLTPNPLICDNITCTKKRLQANNIECMYMVMHLATCCNPSNGIGLIGVKKKEYGDIVIVHRYDCKVIEDLNCSTTKVNWFDNFNPSNRIFS